MATNDNKNNEKGELKKNTEKKKLKWIFKILLSAISKANAIYKEEWKQEQETY